MVVCERCGKQLPGDIVICPHCREWTTQPRLVAPKVNGGVLVARNLGIFFGLLVMAFILAWLGMLYL